ncbi:hypothetical protein RFI_16526, partial [Reticulomyxa filosa]
ECERKVKDLIQNANTNTNTSTNTNANTNANTNMEETRVSMPSFPTLTSSVTDHQLLKEYRCLQEECYFNVLYHHKVSSMIATQQFRDLFLKYEWNRILSLPFKNAIAFSPLGKQYLSDQLVNIIALMIAVIPDAHMLQLRRIRSVFIVLFFKKHNIYIFYIFI